MKIYKYVIYIIHYTIEILMKKKKTPNLIKSKEVVDRSQIICRTIHVLFYIFYEWFLWICWRNPLRIEHFLWNTQQSFFLFCRTVFICLINFIYHSFNSNYQFCALTVSGYGESNQIGANKLSHKLSLWGRDTRVIAKCIGRKESVVFEIR